MASITLTKIIRKMQLENLTPEIPVKGISIIQPDINRPALQLAGYFEHFEATRLQIIGFVEYTYMQGLSLDRKKEVYEQLLSCPIPCIVFCRELHPDEIFLKTAIEKEILAYCYRQHKKMRKKLEKETNKIYSIDEGLETRYLEQQIEFKYDEIKTIVVDFLAAHLEINDSNYVLAEKTQDVANCECEVYSLNKKIDANNYTIDTFYVGKENGLCYKNFVETCSLGKKITSYWEIKELSFEENLISNEFARFLAFKEELAPLEFDKWPDLGLGTLVPEYKDGKFVLAMDEGDYALIAYDNTTLVAVRNYTSSLKTLGYAAGVSKTNEANQYIYLTYNEDNIMVIVTFTAANYTLSIKIYQSTEEEINKELAKFN